MNRILGRIDLMELKVVGFPQLPPKAHKSLASFADLQIAYKETVLLHTQVLPCPNSKYHCYNHKCSH